MTNQFFALIEKRDAEKFRKFRTGKFNTKTDGILKKNNSNFVLGLHKGKISKSIWDQIHKHDQIYFTLPKENFKISGIVSKKSKNSSFGEILYPGELNSKQIQYFLFFEKLDKCNILYHEMLEGVQSTIRIEHGVHKIQKQFVSEKPKNPTLKKFSPEENKHGRPKKSKSEVWRFVRNSKKVKELKKLYDDKCQICNQRIDLNNGRFYSEVHHYNPLKKQSDDDYDNMIVVCPVHHIKFDFEVIWIHLNGTTIIDKHGVSTNEKILFHPNHKLDKKNIESRLVI
jgi:predicted restriction endonuclease